MRAVNLLLWTALMWAGVGSSAFGQDWRSPFRHLPDNTMAVMHVRVDALLKSEWGKSALEELLTKKDVKESFLTIKSQLGIDPFDVDSLTFVLLDPVLPSEGESPRNPRWNLAPPKLVAPPPVFGSSSGRSSKPPAADADAAFVSTTVQTGVNDVILPLVIVHARKPVDRKAFLRKKADREGSVFSHVGLLFLNDHTFVIGPDHAVVQFAANTSDKESELGRQLAQDHRQTAILGGYRLPAPMRKLILAGFTDAGTLGTAAPFLNANHVTFAIDFNKAVEVNVRLQMANDRQANLAAQSAKTLFILAEVACERYLPDVEKALAAAEDAQGKRELKDAIALVKSCRTMVAAARVDQRQAEVSITLQTEIPFRHILPLLQPMHYHYSESPKRPSVSQY